MSRETKHILFGVLLTIALIGILGWLFISLVSQGEYTLVFLLGMTITLFLSWIGFESTRGYF